MASPSSPKSPKKIAMEEAEQEEAEEAFRLISQDTDRIDINKLELCMKSVGFMPEKAQLKSMIEQLDREGKGYVTMEEFEVVMKPRQPLRDIRDEMTRAFRAINTEGTGKISFGNLKKTLLEMGEALSDEEIQTMIREADKDGDGQVSLQEFMEVMHKAKTL